MTWLWPIPKWMSSTFHDCGFERIFFSVVSSIASFDWMAKSTESSRRRIEDEPFPCHLLAVIYRSSSIITSFLFIELLWKAFRSVRQQGYHSTVDLMNGRNEWAIQIAQYSGPTAASARFSSDTKEKGRRVFIIYSIIAHSWASSVQLASRSDKLFTFFGRLFQRVVP